KIVSGTEKQFQVEYNTQLKAINLISKTSYTAVGGEMTAGDGKSKNATLNTAKIYKDGTEVSLTAYNINGNNYFKLRDIASSFNIGITWDSATNTVGIDTTKDYVAE
ncbi:MAG: stalk domain-containing protein, partial [Bacillota bacterium]